MDKCDFSPCAAISKPYSIDHVSDASNRSWTAWRLSGLFSNGNNNKHYHC